MARAEAIASHESRRWLAFPGLTSTMAAVSCGTLCGFVVLIMSQRPTRWLVYAPAGLAVVVFTFIGRVPRRRLMTYFIIGLSLNVHYYLTDPERVSYFGNSSPTYFSVPLVLFPAAALAIWTALDAITGRAHLRWGVPVSKLAVLVIASAIISAMLSSSRRYGIYAVVEMLQYFFIYLVAVNIVRTKDDLALVLRLLLVTLAIQCVIFLVQTGSGTDFTLTGQIMRSAEGGLIRATGTVGVTSSGYAIFVEPLVFTAFALWRVRDSDLSRLWTGCLATIGAATIMLTLNRSSWCTVVLGISVVEILCRRRGIARRVSATTTLRVVAIAILAAMIVIPLISARLEAAHGDDWNTRKNLMLIALRMIAGNPILGVGPGAYPFHLRQYATNNDSDWLWVVHNEYLLIWSERGLLGFLAWLAWLRSGLRQAVRATTVKARRFQAFGIGCVAGIVGLLWEYMLNMWPPYSCYALLWCLLGVLVAGNDIYANAQSSDQLETLATGASS